MSGKTEDVCDDYGFHFLDDVAPAVMELMADRAGTAPVITGIT